MSSTELFVFVEGIDVDRYFISEILSQILSSTTVKFEIRPANEIPGASNGGKSVVIKFHDNLKSANNLKKDGFGKSTCYLFILDKDIDELLNKKVRSKHLIYSKHYTIENHLYRNSDIPRAIAAAFSLPETDIRRLIPDQKIWLRNVKILWKDWLILCLFASIKKINNYQTYRRPSSPVNVPPFSPTCPRRLNAELEDLELKSGLNKQTFENEMNKCRLIIGKRLSRGGDCIFKGKWYSTIAYSVIKQHYRHRIIDDSHYDSKLISAVAALWNRSDKYFEEKLNNFVSRVLLT
jgi:hypothetical protein